MKLKEIMSITVISTFETLEVHSGSIHNMNFNEVWEHADCEVVSICYGEKKNFMIVVEGVNNEL